MDETNANYNGSKCPVCGSYLLEVSTGQIWCSGYPKCSYQVNNK